MDHVFFPPRLLCLLLIPVLGIGVGCASTSSQEGSVAARSAAMGKWRYDVNGFAPLGEGTFRISMKNGRLRARVRDLRRGRFTAEVELHDSRMELSFSSYRVSGLIEDGQFNGFLRPRRWDVSTSSNRQESWGPEQRAAFTAERIQKGAVADDPSALECTAILREANGCE